MNEWSRSWLGYKLMLELKPNFASVSSVGYVPCERIKFVFLGWNFLEDR